MPATWQAALEDVVISFQPRSAPLRDSLDSQGVGTLTMRSPCSVARSGEALLIPNRASVVYKGKKGTVGFFVLWPSDWNK